MKKKLFLSSLLILLFYTQAWSATQLKKTVCPSGCDYTSLESCMNANEQDLTADVGGDGGRYFDVEISGTWSSDDTTSVVVENYTTDSTRYINIYTTGDARHDGTWDGCGYKLTVAANSGDSTINTRVARYITIDGLCLDKNGGSTNRNVIYAADYNTTNAIIKNNIITSTVASTYSENRRGIRATSMNAGSNLQVYNNIIFGIYYSGQGGQGMNVSGSGTNLIYNNTVVGCNDGIVASGTVKNNLSYGNYNVDYSISGTTSNNLSSDTSGDTGYTEKTITFVDSANHDYHLASTDTDAIDEGADLSGTFTDDIDDVTRSGTWDIGADEYVSATPTSRRFFLIQ